MECDGGLSFEGSLDIQCDIGGDSLGGGDLGEPQFPGVNRLTRQLPQPRTRQPNLGGAVLARLGGTVVTQPGVPVQSVTPGAQQIVQYSTTTVSNVRKPISKFIYCNSSVSVYVLVCT